MQGAFARVAWHQGVAPHTWGALTNSQGRPYLSSCPWGSLAMPPSSSSSCQCMNLWEKPWQPPLNS